MKKIIEKFPSDKIFAWYDGDNSIGVKAPEYTIRFESDNLQCTWDYADDFMEALLATPPSDSGFDPKIYILPLPLSDFNLVRALRFGGKFGSVSPPDAIEGILSVLNKRNGVLTKQGMTILAQAASRCNNDEEYVDFVNCLYKQMIEIDTTLKWT